MPRRLSAVKSKQSRSKSVRPLISPGVIDIHFHGAFGIDLMTAEKAELDELARLLAKNGVAGFCPTTLSAPHETLKTTIARLGAWIASFQKPGDGKGERNTSQQIALPLGIHLEGPFISSRAAGAHPPGSVRPFSMTELEEYRNLSQGTLKIITLAADEIPGDELTRLLRWARKNRIVLSLGHTHASEAEAARVFEAGVRGVTHGWNALRFHHREPGVLGAALGRPEVFVELIIDGAHVSPTLLRWTCQLHRHERVCFVSDCAPAAGLDLPARPGRLGHDAAVSFGPLTIRLSAGASRLPDGSLAGGGLLLTHSYENWLGDEARETGRQTRELLSDSIRSVTTAPLEYLGLSAAYLRRHSGVKIEWKCTKTGVKGRVLPTSKSR